MPTLRVTLTAAEAVAMVRKAPTKTSYRAWVEPLMPWPGIGHPGSRKSVASVKIPRVAAIELIRDLPPPEDEAKGLRIVMEEYTSDGDYRCIYVGCEYDPEQDQ